MFMHITNLHYRCYTVSLCVQTVPVHSFMQECELNQHARYYSIINEHVTKIMKNYHKNWFLEDHDSWFNKFWDHDHDSEFKSVRIVMNLCFDSKMRSTPKLSNADVVFSDENVKSFYYCLGDQLWFVMNFNTHF